MHDDPQDTPDLADAAADEPKARDHLAKADAPHCSRCGRVVEACAPDAVAVLCDRCTAYLAALAPHRRKQAVRRVCPDCGGPLPAGRRVCDKCRRKRRKATYRQSRRSA